MPQVLESGVVAHACRVIDRELRMTADEWNADNVTSVYVLRRLMEEQGISYEVDYSDWPIQKVRWKLADGREAEYVAYSSEGTTLSVVLRDFTPEQAIAATSASVQLAEAHETIREIWSELSTLRDGLVRKYAEEIGVEL